MRTLPVLTAIVTVTVSATPAHTTRTPRTPRKTLEKFHPGDSFDGSTIVEMQMDDEIRTRLTCAPPTAMSTGRTTYPCGVRFPLRDSVTMTTL